MAYFFFYVVTGILFLVLQTTLFSKFQFLGVGPDLLLITAIYISLSRGGITSLLLIMIFGHLIDICSSAPSGFFLYSFLILYLIIRFGKRLIMLEGQTYLVIWVGVYTIIQGILLCILSRFHYVGEGFSNFVLVRLFPQALYNMVISLLLLPVLAWFGGLLGITPEEGQKISPMGQF